MKAGVITFHSANNYGANLQTWALQKVLKNYGVEAGVIHYHPDVIDDLYDPMVGTQGMGRLLKRLKLYLRNRDSLKRYNKFIHFLNKNYNLIGDFKSYDQLAKAKLNLDAYIVGSDQVWNVDHTGGYDPSYFLEFAEPGKKRIAYAASVGSDFIHPKYKEDFSRGLEGFTAVSVRESSIVDSIKELTDKKIEVVLDPTMLLQVQDYDEIKVESKIKEPYILVYMMERNNEVVRLANKISIGLGLPIIQRRPTKGFKNQLPPFYTADAGEFLGLIKSAEYVITNSFHGTVFSILYEKPFLSMLHSDTGSRTVDLLTQLNLESHIIYNVNEFTDFNRFFIHDKEGLRKRIEDLKQSSLRFLEESLDLK